MIWCIRHKRGKWHIRTPRTGRWSMCGIGFDPGRAEFEQFADLGEASLCQNCRKHYESLYNPQNSPGEL